MSKEKENQRYFISSEDELTPTQKIVNSDDDVNSEIMSPTTLAIKLTDVRPKSKKTKFYPPEVGMIKTPNPSWSITQLKSFIDEHKIIMEYQVTKQSNPKQVLNDILIQIL